MSMANKQNSSMRPIIIIIIIIIIINYGIA